MKLILRITFQNVFKKDLEIGTDKFLEDFQALAAIAYFTQDNGFKFDPTRENYNIESKNGDFICSQMLTDVMYEFNAVRPDEEIAVLKPQYQVFLSKLKNIAREIEYPLSLEQKLIYAAKYHNYFYKENPDQSNLYKFSKLQLGFAKQFCAEYEKLKQELNTQPGNN